VIALLLAPSPVLGQGDTRPPAEEPSQVDIPESFKPSGEWVGVYRIETRAEPTAVIVEDPLIFTVAISGYGSTKSAPQRPRLEAFPAFRERFYIQDLPELDRYLPQESTWEFSYRLRPRNRNVNKVPYLPFVYWNTTYHKYQKPYHSAIPLEVRQRGQVTAPKGVRPLQVPPDRFRLTTGPGVLRRDEPARLPPTWLLVLLFLAPPLACVVWYRLWLRRYPDTARLARQRRSLAARAALKELQARPRADEDQLSAHQASGILTTYLRQRLDLVPEEPTPLEIATHLESQGVPAALTEKVAEFFRLCAAAEFGQEPVDRRDRFALTAAQLIHSLEDDLCLSRPS
jgi:hypothetical protein